MNVIGVIDMSEAPQTVLESLLNLVMTINDEDHGSDLPPVTEALAAIERIVEERVIGTDENAVGIGSPTVITTVADERRAMRNVFRHEQRQVLKQALYGEKE